jgi:hypothetical protein
MGKHKFYSERESGSVRSIGFGELKALFSYEVKELKRRGFLDQYFGGNSNDGVGEHGLDPSFRVFASLGKKGLWPLGDMSGYMSDSDVFDMIEYLFSHVSDPVYDLGGYFSGDYDEEAGKVYFISKMNNILYRYDGGFELSRDGDVLSLVPDGLDSLVNANVSHHDKENIVKRIGSAKLLFRKRDKDGEFLRNRNNAVRELADVLEFLRVDAKKVIFEEDERDLFNIANNFGIRHHRGSQKKCYDEDIFLNWIFYYYLASINACLSLLERNDCLQPCALSGEEKR